MTEENNVSHWFQDNLRIIISIGIVILLVFAIYSYSKRNSRTNVIVDDSRIEEVAMTAMNDTNDTDEINEIIDEIKDEEKNTLDSNAETDRIAQEKIDQEKRIAQEKALAEAKAAEEKAAADAQVALDEKAEADRIAQEKIDQEKRIAQEENATDTQILAENQEQTPKDDTAAEDVVREVIASRSQHTEGVIAVVAVHGDSMTTLARKATTEYVKNNNVTGLTNAHKIYIEDYLRKSQQTRHIHPGTEMEFSQAAIDQAIASSRTLNDAQLNNLAHYAQNVSNL